jgi:hypothetical protein
MELSQAPAWWLTRPDEMRAFLEGLDGVRVEEIGHTAGGRPIIAASFGELEMLPGRTSTSLPSSIAGKDPSAFYGRGARTRQVLLFVGATHGAELEGTVAALHYLNILVTGRDLLGRPWPEIAEVGRKHRFVLIPILNVDGRERFREHVHSIGCTPDYHSIVVMGRTKDGEILRWPDGMRVFPIPVEEMSLLGSYYNDAGINLFEDIAFDGTAQPETQALMRVCQRELPDCVILSHTDHGSLVQPPSAFVPKHFKQRSDEVGAVVGMRCAREGFPRYRIPDSPYLYAGDYFAQSDMVYR